MLNLFDVLFGSPNSSVAVAESFEERKRQKIQKKLYLEQQQKKAVEERVVTLIKDTKHAVQLLKKGEKQSVPFTKQEELSLAALNKLHMPCQKLILQFDMRCRRMSELGFKRFKDLTEALELFIGKKGTFQNRQDHFSSKRYNYSWYYDHREQVDVTSNCGSMVVQTATVDSVDYDYGPADQLKQLIPCGVLLLMAEIKQQNLVNCFHAIAPRDAWNPAYEQHDPIVLATIWELPKPDKDLQIKGRVAHFFVAKW
jgi:hypothetical protein